MRYLLPLLLAGALPAHAGLLINADVLKRHGYTLDQYNAMSLSERHSVEEWIAARQAQEGYARQAPRTSVVVKPKQEKPEQAWDVTVGLENGRLRRMNALNPDWDLEFEVGDLSPAGNEMLLGESPYWSVRKGGQGSGSWLDTGYDAQIGHINLTARYGEGLGGYQSEDMWFGSVLGNVGRAYHLFGPFDAGWSVMGLMRMTDAFPNLKLDETAGLRWRLSDQHAMGYFSGLTQSALTAGYTWTEELSRERQATHDALAFWGNFDNGLGYNIEAGRQENPLTDVESFETALIMPDGPDRFTLHARVEEEVGRSLEYRRRRTSVGGEFALAKNWDMGIDLGHDDISFGGVEVGEPSLFLNFEYRPEGSRKSLRLESGFSAGRDYQTKDVGELEIARKVHDGLVRLDTALLSLQMDLAEIDTQAAADRLADIYTGLDPTVREALEEELGALDMNDISPQSLQQLIDRGVEGLGRARDKVMEVARLAGDQQFLERLAVRASRKEIYKLISVQEVDLLGNKIHITPPKLVALAHAFALGLQPIPPLTTRDVDTWLNDNCAGSAAQIRDCVLADVPARERALIEEALGDRLDGTIEQSIRWAADIVKRETNIALLNVMLAGERFNSLSVDRGRRIGELNNAAVRRSFGYLDARQKTRMQKIFRGGYVLAEQQVRKDSTHLVLSRATAGMDALQQLMAGPAWPKDVEVAVAPEDWPRLLEYYPSAQVLDFAQRAAAKLSQPNEPGRRRLMLKFEGRSGMGMSIARGERITVNLPAVDAEREPQTNLDMLLTSL
jgi:hypothetical protein